MSTPSKHLNANSDEARTLLEKNREAAKQFYEDQLNLLAEAIRNAIEGGIKPLDALDTINGPATLPILQKLLNDPKLSDDIKKLVEYKIQETQ